MTDPAEPVPLKWMVIAITRTVGGRAGLRGPTRDDFAALRRAAYGPRPGLP